MRVRKSTTRTPAALSSTFVIPLLMALAVVSLVAVSYVAPVVAQEADQPDGAEQAPEAAAEPPCSSADHRAFDYWVGEWDVYLPDGRRAGTNTISVLYDGCALREEWVGGRGTLGTSLSFFDARRGVWHQTWVDNAGRPLYLEGEVGEDGVIEMGSESSRGVQKVRWIPQEDGRVRQLWTISTDGGENWQTAFDGFYQRAGTPAPKPAEATETDDAGN